MKSLTPYQANKIIVGVRIVRRYLGQSNVSSLTRY